ncbi:unnamed protein product [Phytophthora fragariaefolia]|uniref:Unnamed protein product n=1 Tax=Phytophthora fragariaefolia TaxID=1490495 RepID=A0A9W6XBE7_9STRA|nr:unnamed protein product [Phytophthora fragariaefolia]
MLMLLDCIAQTLQRVDLVYEILSMKMESARIDECEDNESTKWHKYQDYMRDDVNFMCDLFDEMAKWASLDTLMNLAQWTNIIIFRTRAIVSVVGHKGNSTHPSWVCEQLGMGDALYKEAQYHKNDENRHVHSEKLVRVLSTPNSNKITLGFTITFTGVCYLVMQDADKEKENNDGNTPVLLAATNGHVDVVQYLVMQGAAYKEKNGNDSNTAVIWAAGNGNLAAIQHLIQNGADPTCIDEDGSSVLLLLVIEDISEDELLPPQPVRGESTAEQDPTWFIPPETITRVTAFVCGWFGMVFRAKWADSDVAVKEVPVVELRRFLKEVTTWRNLRHVNIIPFYGVNHRKKPYFIVSQYATKGELVEYLKRKKEHGRSIVWRKLKEVAAGLGYLHSRDVVHGDLKCNNIVVSNDGIAMLIDFGLSFHESGPCSLIRMKDKLGAMAWRAPEFEHLTVLTPTRMSDVYSLGMCWSAYSSSSRCQRQRHTTC